MGSEDSGGMVAAEPGTATATTGANEAEAQATANLLARGMIPLPLLDAVVGFDADEALRARRELQQMEAVSCWRVQGVWLHTSGGTYSFI